MILRRKSILSIFLFLLVGCSSLTAIKNENSARLSLAAADGIIINKTSSVQAEEMLGSAKVKIPEGPNNEVWLFCEGQRCSQGRITLGINTSTHLVSSVAWNLRTGDLEESLEKALGHFPSATFKKKRFLNDYIDYFFESESYSDLNKGITIAFDPSKKVVTTIYRIDPNTPMETAQTRRIPVVTELPDRDTASSP